MDSPSAAQDEYDAAVRRLDWTRLPVRMLTWDQLMLLDRWCEQQLAKDGHCHVPVSAFVRKERRRGATNRLGWRWVLYTRLGATDARDMDHGAHRTRQDAVSRKGAVVLWRWAQLITCNDEGVAHG